MYRVLDQDDEIVSIEYVGIEDTIDINTSGNRLFFANDILTHNSAVEEVEFDHSHISGGISKINTADNVFGIFTSRAMRERGKYQLQLMKTRSSSGVGQKVDLDFDVNSLRITDSDEQNPDAPYSPATTGILNQLKTTSTVVSRDSVGNNLNSVRADVQGSKIKSMLAGLKRKADE